MTTYPARKTRATVRRTTLLDATLTKLRADSRPLREIAIAAQIPFHWLKALSANTIKDPSVNRIQALYEFLSNAPLQL